MARAALVRHPSAASPAVRAIEVFITRNDADRLTVRYVLDADLARLRIPAWRGIHAGERLWEHTCFEIFVSRPDVPVYDELNFAPSGAWATYAFEHYRKHAPGAGTPVDPLIDVRRAPDRLELVVTVALERLSPSCVRAPLEVGLSAVIEDEVGGLSYWALSHPAGNPDFHWREAFSLPL